MFMLLLRVLAVVLIVLLAVALVDGGYAAVKAHYWWMRPSAV